MLHDCQVMLKNLVLNSLSAPAMKYQMYPRVRKEAYKLAVENAFSQILLVVLDNGKVHVEHSGDQENYDNSELLTVSHLEEDRCMVQYFVVLVSYLRCA